MAFDLVRTADGSSARLGTLTTLHGTIETPVFMPVGTRGTVRTQPLSELEAVGAPILLANTYHLMQRPGADVLRQFGGLHKWMGWSGSVLTDSGGFQIFSLAGGGGTTEDGATLRNPVDGISIVLTPESAIAMQRTIGSDIMMVLDQCIDSTSPHAVARAAMERTHRWAKRSLAARGDSPQQLFAIVQGACFEDLRRESAAALTAIDGFDGFAIGGLAVGETREQREDMTELTAALLPRDKPRYLMGVGTPLDILEAVHRGVDMFDCILPTALAQHGKVFTSHGKLDLRRGVYRLAEQPLDAACDCEACARHSRSYLHHLIKSEEPVVWKLLAGHNVRFYVRLMRSIRAQLAAGTFAQFYAEQREILSRPDPDNPPGPKPRTRVVETTRGAFGMVISSAGFANVQHLASGEIMHSVNHPDVEAERVYIQQSQLIRETRAGARSLVVWDVGLGAGHNAMALVNALDASRGHGEVELYSFERDLDAFRLALAHLKEFAHLRHPAAHLFARNGRFDRERFHWRLCEGDFLAQLDTAPVPDVIFFDPFSSKVDTEMWSLATLRRLFARLSRPAELFTYSASTAVRSSFLVAGFHLARGVPSGPKEETTIALTQVAQRDRCPYELLGAEWLERWTRSTSRFAPDLPAELHGELERVIRNHVQFAP